MKIISYRRWKLFWRLAFNWFKQQFEAVASSIDFTPVEEKLDEVKSDVADVKTAVEHIDFSTLAKQGTNSNATNTAILAKFDDITIDTSNLATKNLEQFFDITSSTSYTAGTEAEVLLALESIWHGVTGSLAPLSSFSTNTVQRVVTNGVVRYRSIVAEDIG